MKTAFVMLLWLLMAIACCAESVVIDGVTYEDVQWGSVTGGMISLRHKSGVARIPVSRLPVEVQTRLGIDPSKLAEQAAKRQRLQAEQERKWQAQGYVQIRGQWVSPAEARKYLSRTDTAAMLDPITQGSTNVTSLAADIRDLSRDSNVTELNRKRATLVYLQTYGHEYYQSAVRELLHAYGKAVELRNALQEETAGMQEAGKNYEEAVADLRGYPARNALAQAGIETLQRRSIEAQAYYKRVEQLRDEAIAAAEKGAELKRRLDAAGRKSGVVD